MNLSSFQKIADRVLGLVPNIYTFLNLLDVVGERVRSLVERRPYNTANTNTRAGVYARAHDRFNYLVQGGDLINKAPVRPLEPLVNVKPEDHAELRSLGAVEKDGKFLMPDGREEEERWVFKRWFPEAPRDLRAKGSNWYLTADGRPTNGYILPEDLFRGGDSTATALVMGAFPVLFALGYALWQIPVFGAWLAIAICGPMLALHAYVLYQAEGAGTLAKVVALSGLLPVLAVSSVALPAMTGGVLVGMGALVGLVLLLALVFSGSGKRTPLYSAFSRFARAIGMIAAVVGLNMLLKLLPESLSLLRPLGWFVVACAYPLFYTLGNFNTRTAELELLSKQRAGSTHGTTGLLGKTAPVRMEQIRAAHRDTSPFIPLGTSLGVLAKHDLAIAPDMGQEMGLSVEDAKTHVMVFGYTGKGKTAKALRPYMLQLAKLPIAIGAIVSDGKGALVADTRDWFDIIIEPGTKFAPFQGMNALMIATAFAEANGESFDNKDSIWVRGAGTLHRYCLEIHQALVEHEKVMRAVADQRMAYIEQQVEYLAAEKVSLQRQKKDTLAVDAALAGLSGAMRTTLKETKVVRTYTWTPGAYMKIQNTLCKVVLTKGDLYRPCDETLAMFRYLGWVAPEGAEDKARFNVDADTIHPHVLDPSRVLSQALDYILNYWTNGLSHEQRNSFQLNAAADVQGFLQNDALRGHLIDGVDHGDQAWSYTEEGVDILQCLYGKKVGINLSEDEHGTTARVINKLIDTRVYYAVKDRNRKYGDLWPQKTGQTFVVKIQDECQDLISYADAAIVAKARSMGLTFFMATQTYASLDSVLKSADAKNAFLDNFRSDMIFETSPDTYEYIQRKAGAADKLMLPVSVQATLDTKRAIDTVNNTIYADENHPSAHVLRDLERRGSTRLQPMIQGMPNFQGLARKVPLDELKEQNSIPTFLGGEYKEGPILEMKDMTTYLLEEGNALLYLNRAGHPRVDFARLEHITTEEFARRLAEIRKQKATAIAA